MGSFDDLDTDPLPPRATERPQSDPIRFAQRIKAMLLDASYLYAMDTLEGILETVERTGYATEGQIRAVNNIADGAERHEERLEGWRRHERRTGRRYEGWDGRQK